MSKRRGFGWHRLQSVRLPPALRIALLVGLAALRPVGAQRSRLDLTLFLVQPRAAARSGEVFAGLGTFRPGIGTDFGVGYNGGNVGATLSGGLAGVEVGARITRNGIDMGREPGIYRSLALMGHWSPPLRIGRWRPLYSAGYLRSALDNVLLRADSLPGFARSLAPDPPDSIRRPTGISGSGVRAGIALQRAISAPDFSGRMVLSIEAATDIVRFRKVSYAGRRAPIPGPGTSLSPRIAVAIRWSPRAPPDTAPLFRAGLERLRRVLCPSRKCESETARAIRASTDFREVDATPVKEPIGATFDCATA